MIITEEELMALLESPAEEGTGFHAVTLYALDNQAYHHARASGLPSHVQLWRARPDASWQWAGLFASGAIALFDPAAHQGADYLAAMSQGEGVYRLDEPWQDALALRHRQWGDWLAGLEILLLEDHPFQGAQLQLQLRALGLPCRWVQDGAACLQALAEGNTGLLLCDLSLAEQDAISLLLANPQYQSLPLILLSAHEQTLIDGSRRLLHDAGFNVLAALAKPLQEEELLRQLKVIYLGPQHQRRLHGLRRTIRTWQGASLGTLSLQSNPPTGGELWLPLAGLSQEWPELKAWLEELGRAPQELTLVIQRRDALLTAQAPFALVLQASLAGVKLALLLDNGEHLPFDLIERLPFQHLLLGQRLAQEWESAPADSLLDRFIGRVRDLGIAIYLDDSLNLQDEERWRLLGAAGRW
ncbi:response regulator [Aeromonas bivalvium]|uniref:response regulator n=1 Tax=Aeromonas bivalvium TaxID=440079 RepID=UPI0038D0EC1C